MTEEQVALGILWYLAFLFSLTCHEAAHAWAAKLGGDLTAFHGGQVTLSPLPHMIREPFGTIFVPIISFLLGGQMIGWASAPYDPYWQQRHPKRAGLMALAGPAANFAIVLIAAALIHGGIAGGWLMQAQSADFAQVVQSKSPGLADGAAKLLSILFSLNLLLGVFNLLPVPPLDGHGALGLILPEKLAAEFVAMGQNRMFAMLGIVLAWGFFGELFDPIFTLALNLLYPGARYS